MDFPWPPNKACKRDLGKKNFKLSFKQCAAFNTSSLSAKIS